MTAVKKIDSNLTGLRIALETTPGVLPVTPNWVGFEPNTYKDFGAVYKKVQRAPINASRQRKKGVIVDLDAKAGWAADFTQNGPQFFMPGLFWAAYRTKAELAPTSVTSSNYVVASGGAAYVASDLLFAKNFAVAGNNGLKTVTGSTSTTVAASGLATDASAGIISKVGFQFASGDAAITVPGGVPTFGTTVKDLTTLGLKVGEWVFVGGDAGGNQFATAANNCFARILTIATNAITFDKTFNTMVADAGTGKTIQLFFGRVIQNELATQDGGLGIVKYTYQLERTLGAPDDSSSNVQAEYLVNTIMDDFTLVMNTADKLTYDMSVISGTYQTEAAGSQKSGTRPAIVSENAYNATTHVKRAQISTIAAEGTPLFAYLSTLSLQIKNNTKANKAVSVLGAFDLSAGDFTVSATSTAYFANVAAVAAIPANTDCTLDIVVTQNNQGFIFDFPLLSLGDGALKVTANEPITLPLTVDAATAASVDVNKNYTCMAIFYDYLPNAAM
jgi:hypothetical protein